MADEVKIVRIVIDSSKAVDGSAAATRALQQIDASTASTANALSRMEKALGSIGTTVKTQLGLYIVELGMKFLEMGKSALEAAADLEEMAEQMGVTTRGLQALQFAAVQNGVSTEKLQLGVTKFSRAIGEAANGSKQALDSLNQLGVKILDINGKLRPTEDLMSEVAARIIAISDPAKQGAASFDFFGKSGAKFIPVLREMAQGFDSMADKAKAANAIISDEAIRKLDALKDAGERTKLTLRAMFAENLADPLTKAFEFITTAIKDSVSAMQSFLALLREALAIGASASASAGEVAQNQLRRNVLNPALEQNAKNQSTYNSAKFQLDALRRKQTMNPSDATAAQISYLENYFTQVDPMMAQSQAGVNQAASKIINAATMYAVGNEPPPVTSADFGVAAKKTVTSVGISNPADKAEAESIAAKISKLRDELKAAKAAQDDMTEAAGKGDQAFAQQEAHLEALQKALGVFGGKLTAASPEVRGLTAEFEKLILATKQGKLVENFELATTELQHQNEVLAAEVKLANELPEIRAKELSLIKATQEAQKAGLDSSSAQVEKRKTELEINERLKIQQGEIQRAQELWTEPLKQALRDIQTSAADAFMTILDNGNLSFQSLGETFTKIVKRMAAEFLALAFVRPVLGFAVEGLTGAGVISANTASQLGFPSSGGGGIGGSASGNGSTGGGLGSFGGFGGLNNFGNSISGFLSRPITSFFSPTSGYADVGSLISSGQTGASAAAGGSFLGGISVGQGLGAIGGIGMGAYQLLSGGGSTGSTISGIGSMIGGAVSLIPGIGQIAGPLIMIGSSILGGLIGGGKQIPPMPALNYQYQGIPASSATNLIRASGGRAITSQLYSGGVGSGTTHTWNGNDWSPWPYTEARIFSPQGGVYNIGGGMGVSPQTAADQVQAKMYQADIASGAITGLGETLKKLAATVDFSSTQIASDVTTFAVAYDHLGKAGNPVKDSLDKVAAAFDDLTTKATQYGVSLDPISVEQERQTKRTAQDFIDNMLDPLAVQMRALQDERDAALESAKYINDTVSGVYADTAKIAEFYTNKKASLEANYYQTTTNNLQTLIARLTYGDLANASPTTSLAGTKSAYETQLAMAQSGNASAIQGLGGYAEQYATALRGNYASGPTYTAGISLLRQQLEGIVGITSGGAASASASPLTLGETSGALVQSNAELRAIVSTQSDQIATLSDMVTQLSAQLRSGAIARF